VLCGGIKYIIAMGSRCKNSKLKFDEKSSLRFLRPFRI
jgi:hypothetical protein